MGQQSIQGSKKNVMHNCHMDNHHEVISNFLTEETGGGERQKPAILYNISLLGYLKLCHKAMATCSEINLLQSIDGACCAVSINLNAAFTAENPFLTLKVYLSTVYNKSIETRLIWWRAISTLNIRFPCAKDFKNLEIAYPNLWNQSLKCVSYTFIFLMNMLFLIG